jgi:glycosyltransferase involved in cell wall biosynthesis
MRILFLARYINSSGVTNHMLTLGKEFLEKGHEVAIMSGGIPDNNNNNENNLYRDLQESGVTLIENGFPKNRVNKLVELTKYFLTIPKSLYLIRSFSPDIIHVHWPITSYLAKIYQIIFKIPIIQTFHIGGTPNTFLHQSVDAVIAISSELEQEAIEKFGYTPNDIHKIHNGVHRDNHLRSADLADKFREKIGIGKSEIIISIVGSLDKRKGIDVLLSAVAKIKGFKNFKVLIIGDGDEEWVKELVQINDLKDYVQLFPFQDPYEFYNISDIFVLPSRKEGFGLVVVEAMLMGIPVIRSNTEGARDQILHEQEGFIFKSEDSVELSSYLYKLMNDEELRRKVGISGREKAEKFFTSTRMSTETLKLYSDILNKY